MHKPLGASQAKRFKNPNTKNKNATLKTTYKYKTAKIIFLKAKFSVPCRSDPHKQTQKRKKNHHETAERND